MAKANAASAQFDDAKAAGDPDAISKAGGEFSDAIKQTIKMENDAQDADPAVIAARKQLNAAQVAATNPATQPTQRDVDLTAYDAHREMVVAHEKVTYYQRLAINKCLFNLQKPRTGSTRRKCDVLDTIEASAVGFSPIVKL